MYEFHRFGNFPRTGYSAFYCLYTHPQRWPANMQKRHQGPTTQTKSERTTKRFEQEAIIALQAHRAALAQERSGEPPTHCYTSLLCCSDSRIEIFVTQELRAAFLLDSGKLLPLKRASPPPLYLTSILPPLLACIYS